MLKELPPIFKIFQKNKGKIAPKEISVGKEINGDGTDIETETSKSLNLLNSFQQKEKLQYTTLLKYIKSVIIFLQIIFVILIVYNYSVNLKLAKVSQEKLSKERALALYSKVESAADEVMGKIDYYKILKSQVNPMSGRLLFILNQTAVGLFIKDIKYIDNTVEVFSNSNSPLGISTLISKYSSGPDVSGITLKTVVYDSSDKQYSTDLEILFK